MLYSRAFTLIGFLLIVVCLFGSDKPPLFVLLAIPLIFVLTTGANWLLWSTALLFVFVALWSQNLNLRNLFMAGGGLVLLALGINTRCPRCGLSVGVTGGKWRHDPNPAHCVVCGRSRRSVWPLQYLLRPERWDGEYHDQGGGAVSDANGVDWLRDLRRKARKRHRHSD